MSPRIVYLSFPANQISGGIKLVFKHVEILNELGFACVAATPSGESPDWFFSSAPVIKFSEVVSSDILVFPENWSDLLASFERSSNRKVVFCQNQFMIYRGVGNRKSYSDYGVTEIMAEGRHVVEFCQRRFPEIQSHYVPVEVDQAKFKFIGIKKVQIAYAPRKRHQEFAIIKDLFRSVYPQYGFVTWAEISNASETKVAQILGESAIYLALCRFEALPLSILEAFSCGCLSVGFTGIGGRDYANRNNGFWVEEDDVVGCVERLGRALDIVTKYPQEHNLIVEEARRTAGHFNRSNFARYLTTFWNSVIASEVARVATVVPPSILEIQEKKTDSDLVCVKEG